MNKEKLYKDYHKARKKADTKGYISAKGNTFNSDFAKSVGLTTATLYKYLREVQQKRAGIYEVIARVERGEDIIKIKKSYEI